MDVSQVETEALVDLSRKDVPVTITEKSPASDSEANTSTVDESVQSGLDDRHRPKRWPRPRKWLATLIMSAFAFLQPLTETMLAPAEKQISEDLRINEPYQWLLVNSLILVGVGLAPLLLAPLSEVFGRKPVLVVACIFFVIWNTSCGAANTLGQLLAFRLLSGFGASVADTLAGGLMSDLWDVEERGRAFAIYMAAPLLGPALGPILGAFISEGTDWRWIFWVTSIASGVVVVIAIICLPETYGPRIEYLHLRKLEIENSSDNKPVLSSKENAKRLFDLLKTNLQRPLRMLATQAIIQLLAVYMALVYGTMFLFLFMYPLLWTERYHQSVGIASLNYLSFAIGLIIGVNIAGHLNDYLYLKLKARNNGIGRPEYRVPPMILGTALIPIGLIWWGWTGQAELHWILPNIGSLLLGTGVYVCSGCVSVYTIDAYDRYAASAISTNLVARSLAAAFFPLFAPYVFESLGFGLGATVIGGGFAVLSTVIVFVLWFFGENLRARSTYCAGSSK